MQVLFLNMESDIGAAGAFVFAHNEAIKAMKQMLYIIEDSYDCSEDGEACPGPAESDKELVNQVQCCLCGLSCFHACAQRPGAQRMPAMHCVSALVDAPVCR